MKKKGDYPIPFDKHGNQLDYAWDGDKTISWPDNHEFDDTLTLVTYGRGRSSITFTMRRANGKTVSVFVSNFCEMANDSAFKAGSITGRFTFVKKGTNYGCKLVAA